MGQMSGNYTINAGAPTSGSNFNSFGAAESALESNGLSGHVVINVVPNSGPYNEQISLDSISGLAPNRTLTFNGNGNTLTHYTTTAFKQVFLVNGCPYVTVDSLNIKATSTTDAVGIHFINGSHYGQIRNCEVDLTSVSSSTSVDVVGIAVNGAKTWTNGSGNTNYVTAENNIINGGIGGVSYGIKFTGGGFPATYSIGHQVINNQVYDPLLCGITVEYMDSVVVTDNDISKPNLTSGDFRGIGIYSGASRIIVERNRIHNSHNSNANSNKAYGITLLNALPSSGGVNVVRNNLVYDFNGNGEEYGIYCFSSNNVRFYHNTISLDNSQANSGNTYGYYQVGALAGIHVVNNIFSITRGGTGVKYMYYFSGGSPTITSNHNVFYMNSSGSGSTNMSYWNSASYPNLTSWQSVSSGVFDTNSTDVNPLFLNLSGDNLRPSSYYINNMGQALTSVLYDFDGNTRDPANPDPGAYEFSPPPIDVGIISIDSLGSQCPGTVNVYATIANFGTDTLKNVMTNWRVNGVSQGSQSWTLNLASQETVSVLLGSVTLTSSNMLNFTVFTFNPNGVNDTLNYNDTTRLTDYRSALSGTYTIGSTGIYPRIIDAVNDLNKRGICGPVMFNVDSASGPYLDQLRIGNVEGSSESDTIVFNGNNSVIQVNLTNLEMYMLKFDASRHIYFQHFNLTALGGNTDEGGGILLSNGAENIHITSCLVNMDGLSGGNFKTGSIALMSDQNAASVASHCVIRNNTLKSYGVRNGIYVRGQNGMQGCYGNIFQENVIQDIYSCGIYQTLADSSSFIGNDISRKSKLINWSFVGVRLYGDNHSTLVAGNRIHSSSDQDPQMNYNSTAFDVSSCSAPTGKENRIVNNLVYDFNNRGLYVGLYCAASSGLEVYHNTIVFDYYGAGNGAGNGETRVFSLQNQLSNISVQNNLIYMNRAGTANKYIYYLYNSGGGLFSDHNAYYLDTLMSQSYFAWTNNNFTKTLDDWQVLHNHMLDASSAFDEPRFDDPSNENFVPFSCLFDGIGDSLGVIYDLNDSLRNANYPDPGALEFSVSFDKVTLGNDTSVCISKTFELSAKTGFESYLWSTGGTGSVESIFALDLGYGDSTIFVTAWDSIMCESTDSLIVTVEDCTPGGVSGADKTASLHLYPVPTKDILNIEIECEEVQPAVLTIIDIQGQTAYQASVDLHSGNNYMMLDLNHLKSGVYSLLITSENDRFIKKFIKQ